MIKEYRIFFAPEEEYECQISDIDPTLDCQEEPNYRLEPVDYNDTNDVWLCGTHKELIKERMRNG
jgi:hypothetical protein